MAATDENLWHGAYKIPWHEPGFSRRMLAEHLSQDHDMASRRIEWIDRQVEWIDGALLGGTSSSILDLGCGPGFYSHRLAARGHRCRGIDFGPASIAYARQHNEADARCEFVLGDLREAAFGGPHDLAMILFGELNVFSPAEALSILRKARTALTPRGLLIVEMQTPECVEDTGRAEPSEVEFESGLFSDNPYRGRTESRWIPEQGVAVQTFSVTETCGGHEHVYRNTTKAWTNDELMALLEAAGFHNGSPRTDWPCNTDCLALWIAGG